MESAKSRCLPNATRGMGALGCVIVAVDGEDKRAPRTMLEETLETRRGKWLASDMVLIVDRFAQ